MKLLFKDFKKGVVRLKIDNASDLFNLYMLLSIGDHIKSKGFRKLEFGNTKEKKRVVAEIVVEKKTLDREQLRVSGPVVSGHVAGEELPKGVHQGFTIKQGQVLTIIKSWNKESIERLEKALKEQPFNILILCFDNEQAVFASLKPQGFEVIAELKSVKSKKLEKQAMTEAFCKEISSKLSQILSKDEKPNSIVIASPSFWKEYLKPFIKNILEGYNTIMASCSHAGVIGIKELLKRQELSTAFKHARLAFESRLIEELKSRLAKKTAVYGFKQCKQAASYGAIEKLLISNELINESTKSTKSMQELEQLINNVEKSKGSIEFLSFNTKELNALSGIAAFLRWELLF